MENLFKKAKDRYLKGGKLNAKRVNMKQVNRAIQKEFPTVVLVKANNYFFIASDDKEWGLKIAGLYQQSVHVARLNELTLEQWVNEVRCLFNEDKRH